jgi:epoxide hydrolase-like predicted phosphatase
LTNNWIDDIGFQGSGFHELQLSDYFDFVVESCRIGLRKPDQSIYQKACQLLQVEPKQVTTHITIDHSDAITIVTMQVVFLDDLGVNVKAARSMGMNTIKVNSQEQALKELSQQLDLDLVAITHKSKL